MTFTLFTVFFFQNESDSSCKNLFDCNKHHIKYDSNIKQYSVKNIVTVTMK